LQALDLLPEYALHDQAVSHSILAEVEMWAANYTEAIGHYSEAISRYEQVEAFDDANGVRRNAAVAFVMRGLFVEALEFARAADRGLSNHLGLEDDKDQTRKLIEMITRLQSAQ
jgi:tetratricopeptide (TPR) repeat protein